MRREYPAGGRRNKKGKKRSESMISGQDDHPVIRNKLEDDTFSPKRRSQRVECSWTNFHCALFLGVGGFLLFWIFLLLRMYLPMENAIMTWWMGAGKVPSGSSEDGVHAEFLPESIVNNTEASENGL